MKLTREQEIILREFSKNSRLRKQFYLTGGTALSAFYLHHRFSEDLDFFTQKQFENAEVVDFVEKIRTLLKLEVRFTQVYETRMFELVKAGKLITKLDFGFYHYPRIAKGKLIDNIDIDSLLDIAINKLFTINQRMQVKDFVDLYFLLKKFTIWDLMEGVNKKFKLKIDPVLVASDFLRVNSFENMPRMIEPLTLEQLKDFFINRARELGQRVTE